MYGPANGVRTGALRAHRVAEAEMMEKAQAADTLGRQAGLASAANKPATAFEEIVNRLDNLAQRLAVPAAQFQRLADLTLGEAPAGPSEAGAEDTCAPCALACVLQRLRTLEQLIDWVHTSADRLERLA